MSSGVEYSMPSAPAPVPTCCICMELWTSDDTHRMCCIPRGHVYGRSCLERLLRHRGPESTEARCPQCGHAFESKNIINLFVTKYPLDKSCHKKMWIYIKAFNGKTIALEVDSIETTKKVKAKIQDMEGIHTDQQCLIMDSSHTRQLDDGFTLANYNLCNGSTLHLLPSPDYELIFVKAYTGKTIALAVKSSYTIKNVKAMIQNRDEIPTSQQRLMIDGSPAKELEDRGTLANYGVHNGSTLHLLPALIKGCTSL